MGDYVLRCDVTDSIRCEFKTGEGCLKYPMPRGDLKGCYYNDPRRANPVAPSYVPVSVSGRAQRR